MRIVVRGTNWIGDVVMSIPALRELRRLFPDDHIALHTRSWAEGIFRDADFVDEIITYDRGKSKIRSIFRQADLLSSKNFDVAILFPNSYESVLAAKLAGIKRRFGYGKDGRGLLLTDRLSVPEWKNSRHEVFYYLELIAAVERNMLGTSTVLNVEPHLHLPVSQTRRDDACQFLIETGIDPSKKTVALAAGSTNSRAKRWGAESYAALNDKIQNELDANVILLGAEDEADVSNKVIALSKTKPFDLTGKTNLADAIAVLSEVDLLISNDMGLAHVAPAVGTDTIVIFGPTNPETTRPFSENAVVIRAGVECSPCMLRDCPIDHRCMTRVTVDSVFANAKAKLEPEPEN
jgi:heptosyltransferase-2